ncbi:hypothetical protein BY458DRAFT_526810 [Sporodiniella umbellata]|nr:hypothetical protein BY458DRAFT_526810 [Sporodiniella umbellata]
MSFQSALQKEGWKLQSLLTKTPCHKCLSRVPEASRWTSIRFKTTTTPPYASLEGFRSELYNSGNINLPKSANLSLSVEKVIARRLARKRLLKSYWRLKMHNPQKLKKLSAEDVQLFIQRFSVYSGDIVSKRPMIESFYILREIKDRVFTQVTFTDAQAERMIFLATELKWFDKAVALTRLFAVEEKRQISIKTLDSLFQVLSERKDIDQMKHWWKYLKKKDMNPTEHTMRAFFMCYLRLGKQRTGVNFIQATAARKYHLARMIYMQRQELGMNGEKILKNLISRCLSRKELRIAESILDSTISLKDTNGAQICSEHIINYYISRLNNNQAIKIWEKMMENGIDLDKKTMDTLMISCANAKLHADTLRLYHRYQEIYPAIPHKLQTLAVRCMVNTREFDLAKRLSRDLLRSMPKMRKPLAALAARSLFSLSAKTGDFVLFEKAFNIANDLNLFLKHRALTSLAACYVKSKNTDEAKIVFKNIVNHTKGPDIYDFNILMRVVMEEDKAINHEKILDILKHMSLVHLTPNETTMRTMTKYYKAGSSMLLEIYKKMLEMPLKGSDLVYLNNIAISKQLQCEDLPSVVGKFFDNDKGKFFPGQNGRAIERDGITYKILLVDSLKHSRHIAISERLIKDMLSRDIKPSRALYESFIRSLCQQGKIKKARRYIEEMEANTGEKPSKETYTKLISGLVNQHKTKQGKEVSKEDIGEDCYDRRIRLLLGGNER